MTMNCTILATRALTLALGGILGAGAACAQSEALPEAPSATLLAATGSSTASDPLARYELASHPLEADAASSSVAAPEPIETASFRFPDTLQTIKGQGGAKSATTPAATTAAPASVPDCPTGLLVNFMFMSQKQRAICQEQDPLQFIVEPGPIRPLTPRQKAELAGRAVIEPFNLITIVAFSGISVAANAHSAYGPGFHGWGLLIGYSLVEDIQGETTGTFLIPTLAHEDPRYHRLPGHPFGQRLLHAIGHTVLSQHDDGTVMLNYATLLNYPLSAEISNLYVPGVATNAPSTAKRIAVGYATDPVGAIVAEFLPDVAKRIHIHILFAQQILNQIALGQATAQQ